MNTISISFQRSIKGSKWFYGNFTLGLEINNHPRWIELVICLVFWNIIIGITKKKED